MIESVITGHQKTDAVAKQEIGNCLIAEQFKRNEHGRDGAVCHAAEYRHHADRRAEGGRKAEKLSEQAAERGADEKGRDDFTAFKTGFQRQCGKDDLPEKGGRGHRALDGALDDRNAGPHIVIGLEQYREADDDCA